jgi:hypothetical protein
MSRKQKLIDRLNARPKDFTYDEARTLLGLYGFTEDNKGRTSGLRVMFINKEIDESFRLHKPHPVNALKDYQIKNLLECIGRMEARR